MLSVHATEIDTCGFRLDDLFWGICDLHGAEVPAGRASTPSVTFYRPKAATLELRPSLAESAERVQKLAEQSSMVTGLGTMPRPHGRVCLGCSGADPFGLECENVFETPRVNRSLFRSR